MPPQDIIEKLNQRPFESFRIHLSDGTIYNVRHPELVMVGVRSLVIGIAASESEFKDYPQPLYGRYTTVALSHVVRLEPTQSAAEQGS